MDADWKYDEQKPVYITSKYLPHMFISQMEKQGKSGNHYLNQVRKVNISRHGTSKYHMSPDIMHCKWHSSTSAVPLPNMHNPISSGGDYQTTWNWGAIYKIMSLDPLNMSQSIEMNQRSVPYSKFIYILMHTKIIVHREPYKFKRLLTP